MFGKDLAKLGSEGLLREIRDRFGPQGPVIVINGKRYLNFSSNDYLGLAGSTELRDGAISAIEKFGAGSGASRLVSGGTVLHEHLEDLVAVWKQTESAILFNSGYAANTGIIPALASDGDIIFSDSLNHASIIDGCRLSRAETVIFRHKDVSHLKKLLKSEKGRRKIIITDTVFSMDGDMAPLHQLYELCESFNSSPSHRNSILLYLDDAHGSGVLGEGRGALSHFGIRPAPWIIQMGTFSKALGSFGAFAAGSGEIIKWISNTARSLIFSTALPPPVIAASIAALKIVMKRSDLVDRLWSNRRMLAEGLTNAGLEIASSETPIIPVKAPSVRKSLEMAEYLAEKGIFAPAIRPPSVKEPRIRITVTAAHQESQIRKLIYVMSMWKKRRVRLLE